MSSFRVIVWLLILGTSFGEALAKDSEQQEPCPKCFFPDLWQSQKLIWKTPFKPATWHSPVPFFMIDAAGASFALDVRPSQALRNNDALECFNEAFASRAADIILTAYPLSMVLAGHLFGHKQVAVYGWKTTEAAMSALIVAILLKKATLRARPHTGEPYDFWEGGNSFPSGHAAVSWAIAAYSSKHFSEKRWVPWVAYSLAGLISFARVTSGNHFISDAVVGSMAGFAVGRWVVD